MNVRVDAAGGQNQPFTGDDVGSNSDHQERIDVVHDVWIASFADGADQSVFDTDVGLDDAPVVDDQRVGDDHVGNVSGGRGLSHTVSDCFAATELDLVAV